MDFLRQTYKCGHGENLYNKSGQGGYVANFCFFSPQIATLGVCGVIPTYQYYSIPFMIIKKVIIYQIRSLK